MQPQTGSSSLSAPHPPSPGKVHCSGDAAQTWQRPSSWLGPERFAGPQRPQCWCHWEISTRLWKELPVLAWVAKAKQHLVAAVHAGEGSVQQPCAAGISHPPKPSRIPPVHTCTSWAPAHLYLAAFAIPGVVCGTRGAGFALWTPMAKDTAQ